MTVILSNLDELDKMKKMFKIIRHYIKYTTCADVKKVNVAVVV